MSIATESTPDSGILTIDQAAAYLSIPKATLYTWRTRRAGYGPPAMKFGGCLRYRRVDLDDWVATHVESFGNGTSAETPPPSDGQSLSRASGPRPRSS